MLVSEKKLLAIEFYGSRDDSYLNGQTIHPISYPYSNIRSYLNGTDNQFVLSGGSRRPNDKNWTGKGFLQKAFTPSAQNLIATTNVWNGEMEGNYSTSDKIFILSAYENNNYAKVRASTDYCGDNIDASWSRSPYVEYFGYQTAKFIGADGYCVNYSAYANDVLGIFPALCVSPSNLP